MISIALILAFILSLVHFISDRNATLLENYHKDILSFSGGLLLGIIFIFLLPEVVIGNRYINVFLLMLIGFALFHVAEKFLYQNVLNKKELIEDLGYVHTIGFFINHFMLGFILFLFTKQNINLGFLLFIPILLHIISSSMSLEHLDEKLKSNLVRILLAFSTFIGALAANYLEINSVLLYSVFAFSLGAVLYISSRDILSAKKGTTTTFLLGLVISLVIAYFF